MTCKPFINAINIVNQVLAVDDLISFTMTPIYTGCGIEFVNGSNTFTITRPGFYELSFDADIVPTTTAPIGVQILNNGVVIPGATAIMRGTVTEPLHIHVQSAVRVLDSCKCIINNANIQVQLIEGAGTVDNANIIIEPVKM